MSVQSSSYYRVSDQYGVPQDDQYDGGEYDHRQSDEPASDHPARHAPATAYRDYPAQVARPRRSLPQSNDTREARLGYTFGHGGRQVRIRPIAFWICVGTLVIMAAWSAVTATYFAFHDDVLARLIARQAAMQFAYEDRIADMRAQVDRVTSRQQIGRAHV